MTSHVLIMTHLSGSSAYLLNAIAGHRGKPYKVTVISSADKPPQLPPEIELIHDITLNTATKKVERMVSETTATHILIQSDDVIVSPNIVESMERATQYCKQQVLMTPMSNNEEGSRFFSYAENWMNHKDKRISEVPNIDLTHVPTTRALIPVEWFAFYCAYLPVNLVKSIGLDENLENRYNDVDFCLRAARLGIPSLINMGCLAYHYGSVTLKQIVTPEMYAEADAYWHKKMTAV